jgi:hypothetical protein
MSIPRPCASSDERDMQDTSSKEPRREQDTPVRSSETRNPIRPGGTPLGFAPAMGYSSWRGRSRASIYRPCSAHEEREKVEREERGREGKREVVDWFFGTIVCVGHLNQPWTLYLLGGGGLIPQGVETPSKSRQNVFRSV